MCFAKKLSIVSLLVISVLVLVIVSAWSTRHAMLSGSRFSAGLRGFVLAVSKAPLELKNSISVIGHLFPPKGVPDNYSNYQPETKSDFQKDEFLLIPFINSNGISEVVLYSLMEKSSMTIYNSTSESSKQFSDKLDGSLSRKQVAVSSRNRIWNPYLSQDGCLVYAYPGNDLVAIDLETGLEKWRVEGAFHHSIEPDADGNLWVCAALEPGFGRYRLHDQKHSNISFEDQGLVKISKHGKVMDSISVANLLAANSLEYLMYGVSNPDLNFDPIHLNQITPIITETAIFKKGQILVSLRNLSTVLLVDPESRKILWHQTGPWMNQHCVQVLSGDSISIFDNHSFASGQFWLNQNWRNRIVACNLKTGKLDEAKINWRSPFKFTIPVEGRALPIDVGVWLVEDSICGNIMIFKDGSLVFKWANKYPDGSVGYTSWARYLSKAQIPERLLVKRD